MEDADLIDKIAKLESINDQLQSEIESVDSLLRLLGFVNGLETAKETAKEMLLEIDGEEQEWD